MDRLVWFQVKDVLHLPKKIFPIIFASIYNSNLKVHKSLLISLVMTNTGYNSRQLLTELSVIYTTTSIRQSHKLVIKRTK